MLRSERLLGTKSVFYEATFVDGLVKYLLVFKPIEYLGSIRLHRTQRRTPPLSADINILLSSRPFSADDGFAKRSPTSDTFLPMTYSFIDCYSFRNFRSCDTTHGIGRKSRCCDRGEGRGYVWKIRFSDATINRLLVEEQEIDEIGMDESISRHVSIVCDKTRKSDSFDG